MKMQVYEMYHPDLTVFYLSVVYWSLVWPPLSVIV